MRYFIIDSDMCPRHSRGSDAQCSCRGYASDEIPPNYDRFVIYQAGRQTTDSAYASRFGLPLKQ